MNLKEMSNEELVEMFQNSRDERFFNELYNRNYRLITYTVSKRKEYDSIIVSKDDYMSECCIAFYKAVEQYDINSPNKFTTVVARYMNNACKQVVRRNNMQKRVSPFEYVPIYSTVRKFDLDSITVEETISYENDIFDVFKTDENELYDYLKKNMTKNQLRLLDLLNEGKLHQEIADSLGMSHQNVSHHVRAIRKIVENSKYKWM